MVERKRASKSSKSSGENMRARNQEPRTWEKVAVAVAVAVAGSGVGIIWEGSRRVENQESRTKS